MARRSLKTTEEYTCQARTIAAISIVACVLGLGAIGLGLWLVIYTQNFTLIIGVEMRNVFVGYTTLGGFMVICGMFGVCASLTRNAHGLLSVAILMAGSLVCGGGVWIFIYLQREKVSADLMDNIDFNMQYHSFLEREFDCSLSLTTEYLDALEACADDINNWLWASVWALLSVSAAIMVLQLLLLVTSLMLRHMVIELKRRNDVELIHIRPRQQQDFQQELRLQEPFSVPLPSAPPPQCNCLCHKPEAHQSTRRRTTVVSF